METERIIFSLHDSNGNCTYRLILNKTRHEVTEQIINDPNQIIISNVFSVNQARVMASSILNATEKEE